MNGDGVKLIIVDDDPASSVALMSVLLALRNRNTTRRQQRRVDVRPAGAAQQEYNSAPDCAGRQQTSRI
jgi:hypothetical protein